MQGLEEGGGREVLGGGGRQASMVWEADQALRGWDWTGQSRPDANPVYGPISITRAAWICACADQSSPIGVRQCLPLRHGVRQCSSNGVSQPSVGSRKGPFPVKRSGPRHYCTPLLPQSRHHRHFGICALLGGRVKGLPRRFIEALCHLCGSP